MDGPARSGHIGRYQPQLTMAEARRSGKGSIPRSSRDAKQAPAIQTRGFSAGPRGELPGLWPPRLAMRGGEGRTRQWAERLNRRPWQDNL